MELMNNTQTPEGSAMPTITEFLEARIDEDHRLAGSGWARLGDTRWETDNYGRNFLTPSAVLAECAAKRAIAGLHKVGADQCDEHNAMFESIPCPTIRALAAVYADHPDYRQEWAL